MDFENLIINYLQTLDSSIDKLSSKLEGKLIGLPSWVLTTRRIRLGITKTGNGAVIKIESDLSLKNDLIEVRVIDSQEEINAILSPYVYSGQPLETQRNEDFLLISDVTIVSLDNPLLPPPLDEQFLFGWGGVQGLIDSFSELTAKENAIEFWNSCNIGIDKRKSYVSEIRSVFARIESIIKRKSFLERRVHRFINEHGKILLPSHRRCLYEHQIFRGSDNRVADFILEREQGFAPILIELESPVHKVLTKNHDLTAQVNHARQQISEWVQFIDSDASRNASGDYSFLVGPKERLIIIGKGLEHHDRLLNTRFDGTLVWTYDMFIEEGRRRLNDLHAFQCEMLGILVQRPF